LSETMYGFIILMTIVVIDALSHKRI